MTIPIKIAGLYLDNHLNTKGHEFVSGNQPLQKIIGGKAAYQSPLQNSTKVGVLCIGKTFLFV